MPNVAPELTALTAEPAPSDEGGTVTLRGTFTDIGTAAKHTARVDWGDGSAAELFTVETGARSFALPHRYLNQQTRHAKATVIDDGGSKSSRDVPVTVRDIAPSGIGMRPVKVATATGDAPTGEASEGALVTYAIEFRDPGELDKHTVTVDWADGKVQTIPVGAGPRRLEVQHRYDDDASLCAKVAVADEDGGRMEIVVPLEVRNAAPVVTAKLPDTIKAGANDGKDRGRTVLPLTVTM